MRQILLLRRRLVSLLWRHWRAHRGEPAQSSPCKTLGKAAQETQTHGTAHFLALKTASFFPLFCLFLTSLVLTVLAVAFLGAGMWTQGTAVT